MSNIVRQDPFDELLRGFFVRPMTVGNTPSAEAPQMRVDVKEVPDGYAMHAELPGIKKEDIHVSIDGSVVTISAERQQDKEQKEGERVLRTERYFGKVSRSFQLAEEIDQEKASARFTDGVLELQLPKKAAPQAHRLEIN